MSAYLSNLSRQPSPIQPPLSSPSAYSAECYRKGTIPHATVHATKAIRVQYYQEIPSWTVHRSRDMGPTATALSPPLRWTDRKNLFALLLHTPPPSTPDAVLNFTWCLPQVNCFRPFSSFFFPIPRTPTTADNTYHVHRNSSLNSCTRAVLYHGRCSFPKRVSFIHQSNTVQYSTVQYPTIVPPALKHVRNLLLRHDRSKCTAYRNL